MQTLSFNISRFGVRPDTETDRVGKMFESRFQNRIMRRPVRRQTQVLQTVAILALTGMLTALRLGICPWWSKCKFTPGRKMRQ